MSSQTAMSPASPIEFERKIHKPIIVLGCPRSGTSLVGRILAHHSLVAYWVEPRPVWMHGNAYRSDYMLGPEHLTPKIACYIDDVFDAFRREKDRERFAEKTPSNCLRVPFIFALYPDCRIVHIIRDGRDVARSQFKKQELPPKQRRLKQRLRQTPIWEWPAYVPGLIRMAARPLFLKKRPKYWGPKILGWKDLVGKPHHVIASHVWNATVGAAQRDGRALPEQNYREIRFEHLMERPQHILEEILAFAELPHCDQMLEFATGWIDPTRKGRWDSVFTDVQVREMTDIMRPLLTELGYLNGEPDLAP